jgi:hypothetical protein
MDLLKSTEILFEESIFASVYDKQANDSSKQQNSYRKLSDLSKDSMYLKEDDANCSPYTEFENDKTDQENILQDHVEK